jgi:hypothetical protein
LFPLFGKIDTTGKKDQGDGHKKYLLIDEHFVFLMK